MKVVIFCGGEGLRLREYSPNTPKPMVPIGQRPILWHLMKYYSHYGHRDFVLCLGHQPDVIESYFLHHSEEPSSAVAASAAVRHLVYVEGADRWSITFADTGVDASVGMRLYAVRPLLRGEDVFLANYADGLTDAVLPRMIDHLVSRDAVASFLSVRPSQTFHVVSAGDDASVRTIAPAAAADLWINGGFFVFRQSIFDYLHENDDLVDRPFRRLIDRGLLTTYRHSGFWACMDTFKERMTLEDRLARGDAPWEVWTESQATQRARDEITGT